MFDDKLTKIKSSYGTGFRFPSLYEMYYVYAANSQSLKFVKAENSKSFDLGFEKNYIDYGLLGINKLFLKKHINTLRDNSSLKYFQEKISHLNKSLLFSFQLAAFLYFK